jgi:predicted RNA-binding Zn-ribbon protein involved in translation (DUF1610 family)
MLGLVACSCNTEYYSQVRFDDELKITIEKPCPNCGKETIARGIVSEVSRGNTLRTKKSTEKNGFEEKH